MNRRQSLLALLLLMTLGAALALSQGDTSGVVGVAPAREPAAGVSRKSQGPLGTSPAPLPRTKAVQVLGDPFAPVTWVPPEPAIAAPTAAPEPSAPPLPFTYLGRLVEGTDEVVFLGAGQRNLTAKVGDIVEEQWRLTHVAGDRIEFLYLPLGLTQTLTTGPQP